MVMVEPAPFNPDEIGLRLSPVTFDGGVSRFPTLTLAGDGCVALMVENGGYFCDRCGGGSSKVGRFEAADRRAVKLEGAPNGSMLETIPGC